MTYYFKFLSFDTKKLSLSDVTGLVGAITMNLEFLCGFQKLQENDNLCHFTSSVNKMETTNF